MTNANVKQIWLADCKIMMAVGKPILGVDGKEFGSVPIQSIRLDDYDYHLQVSVIYDDGSRSTHMYKGSFLADSK